MKTLPPRRPRVSLALTALALAGSALLAGCAAPGGAGAAPTELATHMDDSAARRRAETHLALASGYYENGQYPVALEAVKAALQADPSYPKAYDVAGSIYAAMGDNARAFTHFNRALELDPQDANAMHNLGWLQCQTGRYAEAQALFERAVAVPAYLGRANTLMVQGICQARAGQARQAEATLMRSYELDAGNPVTAYNLALLLFQRGDNERARFYIRRLNNSELANAQSLWLGIKVEQRLNDRKAMEQLAGQLRRRFPASNELISYERGRFDE
ncbi:MAG: type IV pilus biogenesis/stability protein PilW [Burkholderiales bacterium]|nr:type IV pilus biogenesis/stability protein PilW [Burkholderiales bacterium]